MTNRHVDDMQKVRGLVLDYVNKNGATNTRDISDYVFSNGMGRLSTATISVILKEFGYIAERRSPFAWRHNKEKK